MKRSLSILAILLAASTALAHQGATGIVLERMNAMSGIAASMKTVSQMLRGQRDYDTDAARAAMLVIRDHASALPDMFPAGSDAHPSEAAPAIWQDTDGFNAIFAELETAAQAGLDAADDPATLGPTFGAVAKTCTACHEVYRISR